MRAAASSAGYSRSSSCQRSSRPLVRSETPLASASAEPGLRPREQRGHGRLGEVVRPPDELDRHALAVAEDARGGRALRPPGVETLEARPAGVLEAGRQVERLRGDDQQLDVGDLVGDPARDTAGEHHLLHHRRKGVGDPLRQLLELEAAGRRQPASAARSARCGSRQGLAQSKGGNHPPAPGRARLRAQCLAP